VREHSHTNRRQKYVTGLMFKRISIQENEVAENPNSTSWLTFRRLNKENSYDNTNPKDNKELTNPKDNKSVGL
jgi:hypothetical protein